MNCNRSRVESVAIHKDLEILAGRRACNELEKAEVPQIEANYLQIEAQQDASLNLSNPESILAIIILDSSGPGPPKTVLC
jgi:hypothetical protein